MPDIPEIIDMNGVVRMLARLRPSTPEHRRMREARTSIQVLREQAGLPRLIPQSQWVPMDFVTSFGTKLINDQRSSSGCTGWSAVQAMMRQRAIRGQPFVRLSGASVYAQINGGRDQGSVIIDAMEALGTKGACEESQMDYPRIYANQIPSNATWYREDVKVTLDSAEECATALQMGMIPQVPIQVGGNFERFDSNGIAGFDPSDWGNHSVHLAGMLQVNGAWCFIMPNSWSTHWGPFVQSKPEWAGCCLLSFRAVDACAHDDDSYAHASTLNP